MANGTLINAFALTQEDIDALQKIEGEGYDYPFNDNGGEPDGNAYLLDLTVDQVKSLENAGYSLESLDKAVRIIDYNILPERGAFEGRWTGWSSSEVAIFENQETADAYYAYVDNLEKEEND